MDRGGGALAVPLGSANANEYEKKFGLQQFWFWLYLFIQSMNQHFRNDICHDEVDALKQKPAKKKKGIRSYELNHGSMFRELTE